MIVLYCVLFFYGAVGADSRRGFQFAFFTGTLLFLMAKRERKESTFTRTEAILFAAVAIAAAGGVYGLAVGAISI